MTQVFLQTSPPTLGFAEPSQYASDLGSMNEIPQFSFPVRSETGDQTSHSPSNTISTPSLFAPKQNHRRSRTSVHVSRTPLPSFSFGGLPPQIAGATTTQPFASSSLVTPPTSGSRHRRAVSEFIGDTAADAQEQTSTDTSAQPMPNYKPAGMAHRHRRSHASGAINTKDLPSFTARSISVAGSGSPTSVMPVVKVHTDESEDTTTGADVSTGDKAPTSEDEAINSAPRTVTFSDRVDTIQPRPISMISSSSSSGSQSTIRGVDVSRPEDSQRSSPLQHLVPSIIKSDLLQELDSSSHVESASGTGIDIVDLDENFDCDPTAASTFTTGYDSELPAEEYDTNQPQFSSSVSPAEPLHISPDADIDLDIATVDTNSSPTRTSSRGSGFQKARASMHSAGPASLLLSSSMAMHRRTESAPSLSPVPFSLRSHEKAADAGFEMTDVFEEDEDDYETSPPSSTHASSSGGIYGRIPSQSDQDVTPKPLVGKRETHSSPSLLPPIQFDIWRPRGVSRLEKEASREEDTDLLPPRVPYITTTHSEPSVSNASSPRYAHSGLSSCEPSPRFQYSVEDVPSLISSGSTVGETTLPNPSLRSLEPSVSGTGTSRSSLAQSNRTHRKRLSIMSMSVSKLFSSSTPAINEAEPSEPPRSYSSAGLKPPRTKTRRLSRMLKFWKKPADTSASQ